MRFDQKYLRRLILVCSGIIILPAVHAAAVLPVQDGLIAHFSTSAVELDGNTVTQLTDLSGRGNHATGGDGPTLVSSQTPSGADGMSFDGIGNFLEIASNPDDFDGRARTTLAVFRPNDISDQNQRVFNSSYDNMVNTHHLYWIGGEKIRVRNRDADGNIVNADTSDGSLKEGEFHIGGNVWYDDGEMLAVLVDEANTRFTGAGSGALAIPDGHRQTRLGAEGGFTATRFFNGDIAAMVIFDRGLSVSELLQVEGYLYDTYVIPEPANVAFLFGGTVLLFLIVRRRFVRK